MKKFFQDLKMEIVFLEEDMIRTSNDDFGKWNGDKWGVTIQ